MNKNILFYPVIITKLAENDYNISFPDIEEIISYGETLAEAYEMAEEALNFYLFEAYSDNESIKEPSDIGSIKLEDKQTLVLLKADLKDIIKKYDNKAVKKNLTIPNWLNKLAEENKINFSKVLQVALENQLRDKI